MPDKNSISQLIAKLKQAVGILSFDEQTPSLSAAEKRQIVELLQAVQLEIMLLPTNNEIKTSSKESEAIANENKQLQKDIQALEEKNSELNALIEKLQDAFFTLKSTKETPRTSSTGKTVKETIKTTVPEKKEETVQPEVQEVSAPAPPPAAKKATTSAKTTKATTIGESMQANKKFLNDTFDISANTTTGHMPPVSDLGKAIGINDRFRFIRELFKGNSELFQATIQQLNGMSNLQDAENFITENFDWEDNGDCVAEFRFLLKRRFS